MVDYAAERKAFGKLRSTAFGQIQRYIADGYAMTEAAKCLTYNVARDVGPDMPGNRIGSDAAKLFAAPVGKIVADYAMQVMGGSRLLPRVPGRAPVAGRQAPRDRRRHASRPTRRTWPKTSPASGVSNGRFRVRALTGPSCLQVAGVEPSVHRVRSLGLLRVVGKTAFTEGVRWGHHAGNQPGPRPRTRRLG